MADYKTDFSSEFSRWTKETPPADLVTAPKKEQQAVLNFLKKKSHLTLVINKPRRRKKHDRRKGY